MVDNPGDCNDGDAAVAPTEPEVCNGEDDDCDGTLDEGVTPADWYVDADGDGHGSGSVSMTSCTRPTGHADNADDCDDGAASVYPGAPELCNMADDDCDGFDDEMVMTYPWYRDIDGDGYGRGPVSMTSCAMPSGHAATDTDCDDSRASVNPGATEVCNTLDDDCDMDVDEVGGMTFYLDGDDDGYAPFGAPTMVACVEPPGYASMLGDCDDGNAARNPGAAEVCNGLDDNCDMSTDESGAAACSPTISTDFVGICLPPPAPAGECVCVMSGRGDCNTSRSDGCETSTATSFAHCGACGNACAVNAGCEASTCAYAAIEGLGASAYAQCAIRDRNVFACWGSGDQNLFLTSGNRTTAQRIARDFEVLAFDGTGSAASSTHQCMIVQAGAGQRDIYCWGIDNQGQVGRGGTGSPTPVPTPTRILASVDDVVHDWQEISVAYDAVHALRGNGDVYSWGSYGSGRLGRAGTGSTGVPDLVTGIDDATDISTGFSDGCAVRSSGQVWCWGGDSFNARGNGPAGGGATPGPVLYFDVGMGMNVPLTGAMEVEAVNYGGCARQTDNDVWCWGSSVVASGGTGSSAVAEQVVGVTNASQLRCYDSHCCAIVPGGLVKCWGLASGGALGDGMNVNRVSMPVDVLLSDLSTPLTGATRLSLSRDATCALVPAAMNDRVVCWGQGAAGQLGTGTTSARFHAGAPTWVMGL
jgi:alpha-tubulin suppressor-like RCC1 family protein